MRGGVMNYVQPIQSSGDLKSTDLDIEENVRTLAHNSAAFRQGDTANGEATANSLSALLRRVSGSSTREIDTLIGDLRDLREKLRSDGDRIHREIVEYAALSQQVMQLSKIISESVKRLPETPGVNR
jgi:mevalonate pyrophosphate decarboxylase